MILASCEAPLDLSAVDAQLTSPTQRSDLFQAAAHDQQQVIVVGGMGTILQSTDGGGNWQRTILAGKPFMVDVTVCPDGRFYAIDKTDGFWSLQAPGQWQRQALPEMTEPQAMTCDGSNVLWVTGGFSVILHSEDQGASWDSWSLDEDLYLTTIQFIDPLHGVVTGEFGTVLLTTDGGANWYRAADLPGSFYPQGTWFSSPLNGWVVGLNGTIWETGDGGQSWQQMHSGIHTPLYHITGFGSILVAVGDNTNVLYRELDGGAWTQLNDINDSRTYLRAIAALGNDRFVVAGGGTLFTIAVPDHAALASQETTDE